MELVHLGALHSRPLETLSHTALSVAHLLTTGGADAAFVFNAANAPFVPLLHLRGIPVAVHVDGLEWRRAKWGRVGRSYYRAAESAAVRSADALIADAQGIANYYEDEFGAATELLRYGAPIQYGTTFDRLGELGLVPGGYHLCVARLEPENNVHAIVDGYRASAAKLPLVVIGSAPYGAAYIEGIRSSARGDDRIRLLGGLWDQEQLDQLYASAFSYLHGHSVGGTNPSLLRAMGAGASTIAYDVVFNREVVGENGRYFATADELRQRVEAAEDSPESHLALGDLLRERAAELFSWDDVAAGYGSLARRLSEGYRYSPRGHRRRRNSNWTVATTRRPAHG
jgi:glycosyltransferase involved in cell wall biosynthesis